MKKYNSYKDLSLEWIGEIPKHWGVNRLKHLTKIQNSGVWGEDEAFNGSISVPVSTTAHLTLEGVWKIDDMPLRHLTQSEYNEYIGRNGDIVVVKSSGSATNIITGKAGIVTKENEGLFAFSNFLMRIRPYGINPKLLYYFLTSHITRQRIEKMVSSTTYPNLQVEEYVNALIPVPSQVEQDILEAYLDDKTSRIDSLIQMKQQMIALLEEEKTAVIDEAVTKGLILDTLKKDSGIEWLGMVPAHWEIKKLKWFARTNSGSTPNSSNQEEYYDGSIPWIRTLDLNNGDVIDSELRITEKALSETSCKINPVNTVMVAMYGGAGTIGKSGISKFAATTNQALCCILPNENFNSEYLHNYIKFYRPYWMIGAEGTRRDPNISQDDIKNLLVCFPPLHEQKNISDFIKQETIKIERTVRHIEDEISLMQEYRTALISEAVTGKIDVRDYQPESVSLPELV